MKKILIPTLLTIATTPLISMVSCKEKEPEPEPKPPSPPEPEPVPEGNCLTFTALEDTEIVGVRKSSSEMRKVFCPDLHYSINNDGGFEYNFPSQPSDKGQTLKLKAGDAIKFWGNNPNGFSNEEGYQYVHNRFSVKGGVSVSGNIMSLIDNGLCQEDTIPNVACFAEFFCADGGDTNDIISAKDLILPTKLTDCCYSYMFYGCWKLIDTPKLEAQELSRFCYGYMFARCTSLTAGPEFLPATNLPTTCYRDMFNGCTALVKPPIINAEQLDKMCCWNMFEYCDHLKVTSELQESHAFFTCPPTAGIDDPVRFMFTGTAGPYTDDPQPGHTYYWVDPS